MALCNLVVCALILPNQESCKVLLLLGRLVALVLLHNTAYAMQLHMLDAQQDIQDPWAKCLLSNDKDTQVAAGLSFHPNSI